MLAPPLPANASARLFLALLPDAALTAALVRQRDQWHWSAGAACYAPADWHVTLHFLGLVPRQRLAELRAALDVPVTPFELRLAQPELWPHGLAVVCAEAVPEALQRLHARLGQALQGLGLKTDPRPLRPHITLARHAALAQPPGQRAVLDWHVDGYALMESTGAAGARYRLLQQYRGRA